MTKKTDNSWKPEKLFDSLIAKTKHNIFLKFFGASEIQFQPSEIHLEKIIPDRVLWQESVLTLIELMIKFDSRACVQAEIYFASALSNYISNVSFNSTYRNKYEQALQHCKVNIFSIFEPSEEFKDIISKRKIEFLSVEEGIESKSSLNYLKDPLPLVLADIRAKVKNNKEIEISPLVDKLVDRKYTFEEKLFLDYYPNLLNFGDQYHQEINENIGKIKEKIILSEPELKRIVKEKIYLLSPEERLGDLSPEERLECLTPEERLEGLSPEDQKILLETLQKKNLSKK